VADIKAIRKKLEDEFRDVLQHHGRISAHLRNEDREMPADWSEMAQFVENDEVLEALEERTRDRVEALRRAVLRIDAGEYTTCASCGGEISDERLELLPTTPICAACA
jgi:RNA polymerase-binding transcription factor DksA